MLNFILINWLYIVIILALILILVILWKLNKKDAVKRIIYSLVCQSEKAFGSSSGDLKYNYVWSIIYKRYPLLALFKPDIFIKNLIEDSVEMLKMKLNDNPDYLLSHMEEKIYNYEIDGLPEFNLVDKLAQK